MVPIVCQNQVFVAFHSGLTGKSTDRHAEFFSGRLGFRHGPPIDQRVPSALLRARPVLTIAPCQCPVDQQSFSNLPGRAEGGETRPSNCRLSHKRRAALLSALSAKRIDTAARVTR